MTHMHDYLDQSIDYSVQLLKRIRELEAEVSRLQNSNIVLKYVTNVLKMFKEHREVMRQESIEIMLQEIQKIGSGVKDQVNEYVPQYVKDYMQERVGDIVNYNTTSATTHATPSAIDHPLTNWEREKFYSDASPNMTGIPTHVTTWCCEHYPSAIDNYRNGTVGCAGCKKEPTWYSQGRRTA